MEIGTEEVGLVLILFEILIFVLIFKFLDDKKKLRAIEEQRKTQLQLEEQRYKKIQEIFSDEKIITQPATIEALKPLINAIANQTNNKEVIEKMNLQHKQRIEIIESLQNFYNKGLENTINFFDESSFSDDEQRQILNTFCDSLKDISTSLSGSSNNNLFTLPNHFKK